MYLKQSDLFWGMSQSVIQAITAKAVRQEFREGEVIFTAEDTADSFYVLIKGKIQMQLPGSGRSVYNSDRVGEIFGWSALIRQHRYLATVVCKAPTTALRFNCQAVGHLLDQHADSAAIFYKQLASALGNRLLSAYELL
ncbi:MAG: cyclic nucleotide-binding domain-containing protein [Desulfosarcinaceae bacterium]|nr:cyclic nucleotide-binding domain-containing protein [Desulfosarcinaceae bacterium]